MSNRNRIISLLIALIMLVCFAACGKNTSETNDAKQESSTTEAKEKTEGNSSPEKTSENKIEVVDIVGMTLPDAIDKLKNEGFSNINHNASSVDEAWIVTAQDPEEGKEILSSDKISLTCNKKCSLYLDLTSENNLMFSQYDISVYLDDEEITVLKNGDSFTQLVEVLSGKHEIVFCKTGDKDFKCRDTISIEADTTYSCDLAHSSSSIDIKNKEVSDDIAGASLEMIDVTGMILSEARDALEKIGFGNITAKADAGIWDEDNWIVEKQSVDSGIKMDKNTEIVLLCKKLDDYFNALYSGKTVKEVLSLAEEQNFQIRFIDASGNEITDKILLLDDTEKTNYIAIDAKKYIGADKTALVTVKYDGMEIEDESETKENPSQEQEEEVLSNNDIINVLNLLFSESFSSDEYIINIEDSLLNIYFYPKGLTVSTYNASKLRDSDAIDAWNSLVDSAVEWSKTISKVVHEDMQREDLSVALYYCDDLGISGNVYLCIMNGTVFYDVVNGIDLLN